MGKATSELGTPLDRVSANPTLYEPPVFDACGP